MKLGLVIGYWSSGPPAGIEESIAEAERLGFDSMWTAEAYGSDCFTPLAWWGRGTSRLRLGTGVTQLSAPHAGGHGDDGDDPRPPLRRAGDPRARCLRAAGGGRVVRPAVRQALGAHARVRARSSGDIVARKEPIDFPGRHYRMPLDAAHGGTGLGKPLKSIIHPYRDSIPIFLGAEGPKNVALAAEIGDGWLPIFFSPKSDAWYRERLAEGFARPGARCTPETFEVACVVPIIIGDDTEACASFYKPILALYIGGMGRGT